MNSTDELIIKKLKELVDKNGPGYLTDQPYFVYKELAETGPKNIAAAGAILMLLASGVWDSAKRIDSYDERSKKIQKDCCFNKKMSDRLAYIIQTLYSKENKAEWKNKKGKGLEQFLAQEHSFRWEGFCVWEVSNGTVDCYYDADIKLKPANEAGSNKDLLKLLKKNPFLNEDEIYKYYEKEIAQYLNREFEEYCTCDDYYEPVVEDFELESYVDDWCRKNGFIIVSCEGEGRDDGYEPKSTRGWY